MQAIQASLAARAGRLGQEAQAAFPADAGGGWSRAIANTLNVPHSEVRRVIDEAAGRRQLSPALRSMLNQDQPIPRQVMSALTNHVADLRDRGMLSSRHDAPPLGTVGGSVKDQMRLASYHASIGQARDAAAGVRAVRPDLNPVVSRIEAASKTADKGRVLDQHLATVKDPTERARQEALLRPLTEFGDKTPKGIGTSDVPGPKGMDNVQPPGPKGSGPASTPGPKAGPVVPSNIPGAPRSNVVPFKPKQ